MKITQHAIHRYRERFRDRKRAKCTEGVIRAYLLRVLAKAKEITPVEHTDAVHKVARNIVFVIKDNKVVTIFKYESHRYKAKRLRHYYLNNSSRKRRQLRRNG